LVGGQAKEKFWTLYKSDRKFKDSRTQEGVAETPDPRFAYF